MNADLYICAETFKNNGSGDITSFKSKLVDFQDLIDLIKVHSERNKIRCVKEAFLNTKFLPGNRSVSDFLNDYEGSVKAYGKDIYTVFVKLLETCTDSGMSLDDMKYALTLEDSKNCSGIIVLNKLEGYESHKQVMSNKQGWYDFRRFYLGKYPRNKRYFLDEAKIYFPKTIISDDTENGLNGVIGTHPKKIVCYLSVLNDNLLEDYKKLNIDVSTFLSWFAGQYKLDGASFEGKKDEKFNFAFTNNGVTEIKYCEPHLKMYSDDNNNNNQHCRIYFKFPESNDKKVFVGYIGEHL